MTEPASGVYISLLLLLPFFLRKSKVSKRPCICSPWLNRIGIMVFFNFNFDFNFFLSQALFPLRLKI
jgi:hypothetical protein